MAAFTHVQGQPGQFCPAGRTRLQTAGKTGFTCTRPSSETSKSQRSVQHALFPSGLVPKHTEMSIFGVAVNLRSCSNQGWPLPAANARFPFRLRDTWPVSAFASAHPCACASTTIPAARSWTTATAGARFESTDRVHRAPGYAAEVRSEPDPPSRPSAYPPSRTVRMVSFPP